MSNDKTPFHKVSLIIFTVAEFASVSQLATLSCLCRQWHKVLTCRHGPCVGLWNRAAGASCAIKQLLEVNNTFSTTEQNKDEERRCGWCKKLQTLSPSTQAGIRWCRIPVRASGFFYAEFPNVNKSNGVDDDDQQHQQQEEEEEEVKLVHAFHDDGMTFGLETVFSSDDGNNQRRHSSPPLPPPASPDDGGLTSTADLTIRLFCSESNTQKVFRVENAQEAAAANIIDTTSDDDDDENDDDDDDEDRNSHHGRFVSNLEQDDGYRAGWSAERIFTLLEEAGAMQIFSDEERQDEDVTLCHRIEMFFLQLPDVALLLKQQKKNRSKKKDDEESSVSSSSSATKKKRASPFCSPDCHHPFLWCVPVSRASKDGCDSDGSKKKMLNVITSVLEQSRKSKNIYSAM